MQPATSTHSQNLKKNIHCGGLCGVPTPSSAGVGGAWPETGADPTKQPRPPSAAHQLSASVQSAWMCEDAFKETEVSDTCSFSQDTVKTFIYSLLTKGKPFPQDVMLGAGFFCSVNGFLQGHYLLHCAQLDEQMSDCCVRIGLLLFYTGMAINIHSDYSLRNLRKPGEAIYKVPTGGFFEYVSAANYFGEILEWFGYAVATWGLPSFSFAVFTACFIGPRAIYHHRFYKRNFKDYPKYRKALIPFLL
ncbi:3-oxo-5-alpha-steroid 4-dehydrogenase 2b isoform X3 [Nerophis lumbriciformis]|uniref:3-oxo-5-alpha-steroid 4-dehydrogenase 2b isoform X3 n=1 Tax=Nerophis lumbriciformis TaxID=546530 RepID=UPI002AE066EA|nr:3-oxo-5-alpha-steroid 4-dehydrogenase 2b isoform X3 [Nerophis lumbriciformis]